MLGYLSLDIICSSKLTAFLELRSRKTVRFSDNVRGQISEHIIAPSEGHCLFILRFTTKSFSDSTILPIPPVWEYVVLRGPILRFTTKSIHDSLHSKILGVFPIRSYYSLIFRFTTKSLSDCTILRVRVFFMLFEKRKKKHRF